MEQSPDAAAELSCATSEYSARPAKKTAAPMIIMTNNALACGKCPQVTGCEPSGVQNSRTTDSRSGSNNPLDFRGTHPLICLPARNGISNAASWTNSGGIVPVNALDWRFRVCNSLRLPISDSIGDLSKIRSQMPAEAPQALPSTFFLNTMCY